MFLMEALLGILPYITTTVLTDQGPPETSRTKIFHAVSFLDSRDILDAQLGTVCPVSLLRTPCRIENRGEYWDLHGLILATMILGALIALTVATSQSSQFLKRHAKRSKR